MPFTLFLALKHIRRRLLQSIITVLGVAVGVMVLVTALSLFNGFIGQLLRSTLQATPHITLTGFSSATFQEDPGILEKLISHSEVIAAAPFLSTEVLMARRANSQLGIDGRQAFSQILGIDPELEQNVLADLPVLARQTEAIKNEKGIVLGASLAAAKLSVIPGEEILVNNLTQGRATFSVAGTFRVGNELIDSVLSFVSIPTLQTYLNKPGQITGYHVRIKNPEKANVIGQELGQMTGLFASSWQVIFSSLIEQLRFQKALTSVVVFLIVLVAAMGIANILILTVAEKTRDIGILRAMGASQGQVMRIFMYEGLLLGGTGTLLGVLLGLLIGLYFTLKPFPLPGDLYFITALPVEMQFFDFAWICLVSLATSIIAALIPAKRASMVDPVQVLR